MVMTQTAGAGKLTTENWNQLADAIPGRSEEHTSELQSLTDISYAVFCLKKKKKKDSRHNSTSNET